MDTSRTDRSLLYWCENADNIQGVSGVLPGPPKEICSMRKEENSRTSKDSDPSAMTLWSDPKGRELQPTQMLVETNKA